MKIRSEAFSSKSKAGCVTASPRTSTSNQPDNQRRLDAFLVGHGWASSRRQARHLIQSGKITVNGRHLSKGALVSPADDIRISDPPRVVVLQPNPDLKIETLYQDDSVVVVNKPGLIPCHPLSADEVDTAVNAVIAVYPEVAQAGDKSLEGGLAHRLDNGTSGALIVARTHQAFSAMRAAIRQGAVVRRYLALCVGKIDEALEVATPIAHHPKNRRKMITLDLKAHRLSGARPAATLITPLRQSADFSLLEVRPHTGRRHQVRVHCASINHALAGDLLYGGPEVGELMPGRLWLHLSKLSFESPSNGRVEIHAPLPSDLEPVLKRIGFARDVII